MAIKDILGNRFGKLVVKNRITNSKDGSARWLCVCDCGNTREIAGTGLRAGRHKSCGCSSPRFTSERMATHGKSKSRVYRIWAGMIRRCSSSSKGRTRKNYFEKGIRVCNRWKRFENFLEDMGDPAPNMTLDRKESSKGYSKDNCRWATSKQQANNMCSNRIVEYGGKKATVAEWADEIGMKHNTLEYRFLRGWDVHEALTRPVVKRNPRSQSYLEGQAHG